VHITVDCNDERAIGHPSQDSQEITVPYRTIGNATSSALRQERDTERIERKRSSLRGRSCGVRGIIPAWYSTA